MSQSVLSDSTDFSDEELPAPDKEVIAVSPQPATEEPATAEPEEEEIKSYQKSLQWQTGFKPRHKPTFAMKQVLFCCWMW